MHFWFVWEIFHIFKNNLSLSCNHIVAILIFIFQKPAFFVWNTFSFLRWIQLWSLHFWKIRIFDMCVISFLFRQNNDHFLFEKSFRGYLCNHNQGQQVFIITVCHLSYLFSCCVFSFKITPFSHETSAPRWIQEFLDESYWYHMKHVKTAMVKWKCFLFPFAFCFGSTH